MGTLIRLLKNVFGSVFGSFFGGEINNLTLLVSYVAAFAALTAGLIVTFNAMWSLIQVSAPVYAQWAFGFLPDNVNTCTTAVLDAKIAYWVFSYKAGLLDKRTSMMKR